MFSIDKDVLRDYWYNGKPLHIKEKNETYSVHKMSYGTYFLEPYGRELPETEGFTIGTLWLKKKKEKYYIEEV